MWDWLFGGRKKRDLEECMRQANGNLDQYSWEWQNAVKECMRERGYIHNDKPGPSASDPGAYTEA